MTLTIEKILGEIKVIPNVAAYQINADSIQYRVGTKFTRIPVNEVKNVSADLTIQELAETLTK